MKVIAKGPWFDIVRPEETASVDVHIYGEIGWEVTASEFISHLDEVDDNEDLMVHLNSVGGQVFEGLAIYNRLLRHSGNVTITIEGLAASMASVIAMAGNQVEMFQASLFMIHNPAGGAWGEADDMRKAAETLDQIREVLILAYLGRTSADREQLLDWMDSETWFTPAEALEHGFIDEIIEESVDIAACVRDFDLSIYANAPDGLGKQAGTSPIPNKETTMKPKNGNSSAQPNSTASPDGVVDPNAPTNVVDIEAAQDEAVQAERKRVSDIRAMFKRHPGNDELLETCIDEGLTPEAAGTRLLDALGDGSEPVGQTVVVQDARAKFQEGVLKALTARAGVAQDDTANEFRGLTLAEIAKQCAVNAGVQGVNAMRRLDYVGAAFSHSTSDFPFLLENTLNKVLLAAFNEWPATWDQWALTGQVSDFKQVPRLKLGSFNNLDLVPESGEFKEKSFGEEKETLQAATKGNLFSITRQAIINDDLGGFTRIATMLGQAARRTVNADVYAVLTANGAMSDGTALFHSSHNNLAGSGAAISVSTLSAGKAAMRKQKFASTDDAFLNINPDILLVPVALEDHAKTVVMAETDFSSSNSKKPNIHRNSLTVISDPQLDADSVTAWYLLSSQNPIVEAVFLDGVQEPFLDSEEGFTVDGVRWKVRLDYGQDSIDYRGAWKNPGA